MVKLLKFYEASDIIDDEGNKRQMCIILFCPTADSIANPIYRSLKNLADEDVYRRRIYTLYGWYFSGEIGRNKRRIRNYNWL